MDVKLPVYKAMITDEETGMFAISLVDDPAVEINWQYFKDDKKPMLFSVQDEEKRLVRGVIMECDKLIYRRTVEGFEYYITFDAQTIRLMAQKYLRDGFQNNVDTMHDGNLVNGVELVQWFLSDKENGVNPIGFDEVNDHSLFAEFHVLNDEIWDSIKDGTFRGFSLAGFFEPVEVKMQINKKSNTKEMSKLEKIRTALQNILAQFERMTTDKAVIEYDGDELEVGMAVRGIDEEGNPFDLEDGEYRTDEGTIYVIAEGKVAEIREPEVAPEAEEEAPAEEPAQEQENEEEAPASEEEPEADDRDERIANLEAEVARLEEELGAANERIAELERENEELKNKSAAAPAEEEFEKVNQVKTYGNKKLDNLVKKFRD